MSKKSGVNSCVVSFRISKEIYEWYEKELKNDTVHLFAKRGLISYYNKMNHIVGNTTTVNVPQIKASPKLPAVICLPSERVSKPVPAWLNPYEDAVKDLEIFEPLKHRVGDTVKWFDKASGHYRKAEVMMISKNLTPVVRWLE